jgi:hypothetical protein
MKNGLSEFSPEERIAKRVYILNNIEDLIRESVYYRTHSEIFVNPKIEIGNIENSELRVNIL